jgi:hypothetical protein
MLRIQQDVHGARSRWFARDARLRVRAESVDAGPRRARIRLWRPETRSWGLSRATRRHAEAPCLVFSIVSSPCSPVSQSALVGPRTSRSSCYATSSACYADRSTGPRSMMMIGPCSAQSDPRSPAHAAAAGSSPPRLCCAGTDDVSPATGHNPTDAPDDHHRYRDPPAHPPPRHREPDLGISTHPRRTGRPWTPDRVLHGLEHSQGQRSRPSPTAIRRHLVPVPALPSRGGV